jgi:microcin C transport system permease protein
MPSVFNAAVIALIAFDFYGFGVSPGWPSLGEMLRQGTSYPTAPWIGLCSSITIGTLLLLLHFIGSGVHYVDTQTKTTA